MCLSDFIIFKCSQYALYLEIKPQELNVQSMHVSYFRETIFVRIKQLMFISESLRQTVSWTCGFLSCKIIKMLHRIWSHLVQGRFPFLRVKIMMITQEKYATLYD
jgi:hypothetical protein